MTDMQPVSSSYIAQIGWDGKAHTLYVEFNSGALWQYTGVEKETFESFLNAPSKGQFFHQYIKDWYNAEAVY